MCGIRRRPTVGRRRRRRRRRAASGEEFLCGVWAREADEKPVLDLGGHLLNQRTAQCTRQHSMHRA